MKRRLAAVAAVAAVLAAAWLSREDPAPPAGTSAEEGAPAADRPGSSPPPVAGQPCQVEGTVEGGVARRVRLHSARGGVDLDAALEGGRRFAAELPEQGPVLAVAEAEDGRTGQAWGDCRGDGRLALRLVLPAPDPSAAVLEGRCVFLDTGAPAAGAILRGDRVARTVFARAVPAAAFSALADDDGRFVARVPAGTYAVRCALDADAGTPLEVALEAGARRSVTLLVEPRGVLAGRVLDPEGRPLAGAVVMARPLRGEAPAETVSDGEGRFLLPGLLPGPVPVEAQDQGRFAEAVGRVTVAPPHPEVVLRLAPSALTIEGDVHDADGLEVAGATVEAFEVGGRGAGLQRSGRTDEVGGFALGGLVAGRYRLRARAEGHGEASVEVEGTLGAVRVRLILPAGCAGEVQVLPAEPALPVVLSYGPADGADHGAVRAVAGRTGEVTRLPDVSGLTRITARTSGALVRTATLTADLCRGGPAVLRLEGREGTGAVAVEVRDPDGAPVEGVEVFLHGPPRRGRTDAAGQVRYEGLAPGRYAAVAEGAEPQAVELEAGEVARVALVVERARGRIAGVVTRGGGPVEGAAIRAACEDGGAPAGVSGAPVLARSDAAGAFAFEPSEGGLCELQAELAGAGVSRAVAARAGGEAVTLELLAPATLRGRVVSGERGAPVRPYVLTVSEGARGGGRSQYVDDPGGAFELPDVSAGRVVLAARADGGQARLELELAPGEARAVELELRSRGAIEGRVVDRAAGSPVPGAQVLVGSPERPFGRAVSGADGRFRVEVPAGVPAPLLVRARGFHPLATPPVDLGPGGVGDAGTLALEARGGPDDKEGGVGIQLGEDPRGVKVVRFLDDSPAREAGLEVADVIVGIDGVPRGREPLLNWVTLLRGRAGTTVILLVERGGRPAFTVAVVRRAIGLPPMPD